MPIVDALVVVEDGGATAEGTAKLLAEALGAVFAAAPGTVWVRVQGLPEGQYAENGSNASLSPVFLSVLLADTPAAADLALQAAEICRVVDGSSNRSCASAIEASKYGAASSAMPMIRPPVHS